MLPIREIADLLKIPDVYLDYYGKYVAKLRLELLSELDTRPKGKLLLVTAMTPTSHGEGKTVVSIGLAQALEQKGKRAIVTLREPSLGPIFGEKGTATGGGKAKVVPSEKINLHFTGDFPAITAAHNLLAAIMDSHIHHGNELNIDINNTSWPRVMDINDRALRHIIVGLGGKPNGVPRETRFVLTAASEIMAIMALASSRKDLRERLSNIVVGLDLTGNSVRAQDLKATGALMALLNEAIMPNLVQTSENTPALVHTGAFANVAHGTCSVISQKMALSLAEYVVNETGFASDLGIEKFCDIVMPTSGLKPAAAILVVTVNALIGQGETLGRNEQISKQTSSRIEALSCGFINLDKHIENLRKYNLPFVIAINRFESDSEAELKLIENHCKELGVESSVVEVFNQGGRGALDLASKVISLVENTKPAVTNPLYPSNLGVEEKIGVISKEIYGAKSVYIEPTAQKKLKKIVDLGCGHLPICIAKTPSSLSDNPKLLGAPKDWVLTITDVQLFAGAKYILAVAGSLLLMPGLSKNPRAMSIDVDEYGRDFINL